MSSKLLFLLPALLPLTLAAQDRPAPANQFGTVRFETSCAPAAESAFTRAVAQLHSFVFGVATQSFEEALAADARCAIAYWGLALTTWGNPFAPGQKTEAQLQRGADAVQRGRAAAAKTERERDYIAAVGALYDDYRTRDQRTRLVAYRDAMAQLAARYPQDTEATTFYALALAIANDPADKTYASLLKAGALLEQLQPDQPNHPGLAHYIIHSYDVPPLAQRALEAAHSYAAIAPSASHALHMPSHTFTRVGSWKESIEANRASATSARSEGSVAEELHATDYMAYAYLQTGQDDASERLVAALPEAVRRFRAGPGAGAAPPAAGAYAIAAIPARHALERGAWEDAAQLQAPVAGVPYADAVTHFARAIGGARSGRAEPVRTAIAELARLRDELERAREPYWAEQVEIQRRGAAAWLAFVEGDREQALAAMRVVADMEDATEKAAVTPGPLAPARELLSEMLLAMNQPAEALRELERTMMKEPNRFRTLAGAMHAAARAGDDAAATRYANQLLTLAAAADRPGRPELAEARRLAGRP